ncbi:MAG: RNA polymerase sigma factor [Bacteroidales bacterium]|nr:RNA polymerase sigma factor [Bacteroidales bacterium]
MNNAAFSVFITSVRPKLYRFSLSLLKRSDAAEDVVQEVGLRLWKGVHKGNLHPHMEALAMCTAKNLCIDILRKNTKIGKDHTEKQNHYTDPHTERSPQLVLEEKEMHAGICKLIDLLPLQQQMCIRLRDVEGYELEEIAQILECEEGSVRTNLSRARKKIREQINQLWNR